MKFGRQFEPIPETEAECRMTTAELRAAKNKAEKASAVASGTDRKGPQGEALVCPTCGQQFPDDEIADPDTALADDRAVITELEA
jgi:hypothetical protein